MQTRQRFEHDDECEGFENLERMCAAHPDAEKRAFPTTEVDAPTMTETVKALVTPMPVFADEDGDGWCPRLA
jgi:hypothetical protein